MGPGIWLYTLITSIEDNTFIRGMKCSVAREVVGGAGPIMIIMEAIQCKVE
jgi:hypothetical protein